MSDNAGSWRSRHRVLLPLVALITAWSMAGLVLANPFTVRVATSSVTNTIGSTRSENIVVNSSGFALYELTGDSKSHPSCTRANACFANWPPAKVKSTQGLTKGPGVPGTLGTWRRDGIIQLTLNGHPLYRYISDIIRKDAMGQGQRSYGGTWHVIPGVS